MLCVDMKKKDEILQVRVTSDTRDRVVAALNVREAETVSDWVRQAVDERLARTERKKSRRRT